MADKTYTTFNIAKMMGVYPSTVAKWIDDGVIEAYATPGGHRRVKEANFKVFLKEHDIPIPEEVINSDGKSKPVTILVVDDDVMVLNSISGMLGTLGEDYSVLTAEDGFEAGQMITMHVPELVVLDIMLPGINGIKVCRIIKKEFPQMKVLPVLYSRIKLTLFPSEKTVLTKGSLPCSVTCKSSSTL